MHNSQLRYLVRDRRAAAGFQTAVSLHSHTLHSKESTAFVERLARKSRLFNTFIQGQFRKYSQKYGETEGAELPDQVRRMWWTSPLSAKQAFEVESNQIARKLGLRPLVSLSDHDNIEAPLQLQMLADNSEAPISVEWTAPYERTYFHIGVHNMRPGWASEMMLRMERFTARPTAAVLRGILEELNSYPDVLVVLNHPYWDQLWLGNEGHYRLLRAFLREHGKLIHGLELNGLRSWTENRKVMKLSGEVNVPLISGGDRHGREPNATLNLTSAATFSEFVDEVRGGAPNVLLVMPQYHDPLIVRVIQTVWDVLADHPDHAEGRVRWCQRVYRLCNDDEVKSFDDFFQGKEPVLMRQMMFLARLIASPRLRPALQKMKNFRSEAAL